MVKNIENELGDAVVVPQIVAPERSSSLERLDTLTFFWIFRERPTSTGDLLVGLAIITFNFFLWALL